MVDELTIRYKDLCGISITNAIDLDYSRQLWGYIGHGNDSTLMRKLCNKEGWGGTNLKDSSGKPGQSIQPKNCNNSKAQIFVILHASKCNKAIDN